MNCTRHSSPTSIPQNIGSLSSQSKKKKNGIFLLDLITPSTRDMGTRLETHQLRISIIELLNFILCFLSRLLQFSFRFLESFFECTSLNYKKGKKFYFLPTKGCQQPRAEKSCFGNRYFLAGFTVNGREECGVGRRT